MYIYIWGNIGIYITSQRYTEITPERMKRWSQSKNNTQLWIWLMIEARPNAIKSNIA